MKHNKKVTAILLTMFILTQLIGLLVVYSYNQQALPYAMQPPAETSPSQGFSSLIIAFVIAIALIFLLMKFKLTSILRAWFFVVVILAIALTLYAFEILAPFNIPYTLALIIPLLIAVPLAVFKVFKRHIFIHNLTELLIYPGIAAVFVSFFSAWGRSGVFLIIVLLIIISFYDIWAVWHTGFMQKMAKFQINQVKVFAGFFVPYADKKTREKLKKLKQLKVKLTDKQLEQRFKKQKIKVNLAILGGGDVVFPIIMAGVILRILGLLPAIGVITGASIFLLLLFVYSKKGKFYPAMPFISAGCFFGFAAGLLVSLL